MTAAVTLLWLALAGILAWIFRLIAHDSSRVPLPRHAGQARRSAYPVAAPDEGPARPGGTAPGSPAHGAVPLPRNMRHPALNPRLYETGEMPGISQAAADEMWWSL